MKIPDKVRIGGVDYAIQYEERLNNGSQLACGFIDYNQAVITLEPSMQGVQGQAQALLHEIIHGIARHFDLAINEDEDTIDKLARGLYMVIKDNLGMFRE